MNFDENDFKIYIKANALLSLIAPIVEDYSKEVGGFIVGNIENQWIQSFNSPILTIQSVYPSVTAKTNSNEWKPKPAALKRARTVAKTMSLTVLGGYHSHPVGKDIGVTADLSPGDRDFIKNETDCKTNCILDGDTLSWLEIVVRIDKKEHAGYKSKISKWFYKDGGKKVSANIYLNNKDNYYITIGAHGFLRKSRVQFDEFPVYLENMVSWEYK